MGLSVRAHCRPSPAHSTTVFDEATGGAPAAGEGTLRRPAPTAPVRDWSRPAASRAAGAVNGGVLLATVLRAVLDSSPHPYPVATSAHFLRVPRLSPAQVEVTWLKHGKTAATARATLVQEGSRSSTLTVTTVTAPAPRGGRGRARAGGG